jgi:hypothetical protein
MDGRMGESAAGSVERSNESACHIRSEYHFTTRAARECHSRPGNTPKLLKIGAVCVPRVPDVDRKLPDRRQDGGERRGEGRDIE